MAEVVPIQGTSYEGKKRNILAPLGLGIITLGIYTLVWYYKTNKELAEIGRAHGTEGQLGTSPGTSLLAITFGCLIIVPPFVSYYKFWVRQQKAAEITGIPDAAFPPVGGFILMFFIVGTIVFQNVQNKIMDAQAQLPAAPAGGALPA